MFSTLESFDTRLSADSVEWCPIENFKDVFVCGTYQLTKQEHDNHDNELNQRLGKFYLFRVENGRLNLLHEYESAAVLDMKWARSRICHKILLGIVTSKGILEIHELVNEYDPALELLRKITVDESEDVLALSLDWSTGNDFNYNSEVNVVVTTSSGTICIFELTNETFEKIRTIDCHEYEAWIAAFDYWNSKIIYTGTD